MPVWTQPSAAILGTPVLSAIPCSGHLELRLNGTTMDYRPVPGAVQAPIPLGWDLPPQKALATAAMVLRRLTDSPFRLAARRAKDPTAKFSAHRALEPQPPHPYFSFAMHHRQPTPGGPLPLLELA